MPSHYTNQCWVLVDWTLRNKLQWNFNQNTKLFVHKNASENIVCGMAAILFRGRWVRPSIGHTYTMTAYKSHPWEQTCEWKFNQTTEIFWKCSQIARFTWPIWGLPGSCRPQVGPMLAPWTLLSRFLKISISTCQPFCSGLNVSTH